MAAMDGLADAKSQGRALAQRHNQDGGAAALEVDRLNSLLNYAEAPHPGDWTFRSGLTRLAQPQPELVSRVLEVSRRLDAPLHHVRRKLEAHPAVCDQGLTSDNIDGPPVQPVTDIRTADLARLVAAGSDAHELMATYAETLPLESEELKAVPLLAVAVTFEELAAIVTAWAVEGPSDPPLQAVEEYVQQAAAELDRLEVPIETGPPPGAKRGPRR